MINLKLSSKNTNSSPSILLSVSAIVTDSLKFLAVQLLIYIISFLKSPCCILSFEIRISFGTVSIKLDFPNDTVESIVKTNSPMMIFFMNNQLLSFLDLSELISSDIKYLANIL